jgi:two-component system NarL family response regulator
LLADGHHFFREGLRGMLESTGIAVVGEAHDATEAAKLAAELKPDAIVIDLNMPAASGTATLRKITEASPEARIVVLTTSTDETDMFEALEAGACGYLLKDAPADELVGGIHHMTDNQILLSRELVLALASHVGHNRDEASSSLEIHRPALTKRELDVLRLIVKGADNATIGLELSISRHTVKQHVTNILEKLGVRTRVEAAVYAVRSGLV